MNDEEGTRFSVLVAGFKWKGVSHLPSMAFARS